MDVTLLVADWLFKGVVLYILIRYAVLRHQEREALKARIEQLEGISAPAMATEHKAMKDFAEGQAKEKQELKTLLDSLEQERREIDFSDFRVIAGYSFGVLEADKALHDLMRSTNDLWEEVAQGRRTVETAYVGVTRRMKEIGIELADLGTRCIHDKRIVMPRLGRELRESVKRQYGKNIAIFDKFD